MAIRDTKFRRAVAFLARQVLLGHLSFFDFIDQIDGYETGDEHIDELVDLLEHQPAEGRWSGAGRQAYAEYVAEINRVIDLLDPISPKAK